MTTPTIAVLVGSLRRESFNRRLAAELMRLGGEKLGFSEVGIRDLPPYDQDDDEDPAPSVVRLREAIRAVDGVWFVTPEYNRSIPGALKNAIDHGSRPYGQSVWEGKPAGVIGVSIGSIGTAVAQQHLRNVLAYLDMPTLGQPEAFLHAKEGFFDADGRVNADSRKFLQSWVDAYIEWVGSHRKQTAG